VVDIRAGGGLWSVGFVLIPSLQYRRRVWLGLHDLGRHNHLRNKLLKPPLLLLDGGVRNCVLITLFDIRAGVAPEFLLRSACGLLFVAFLLPPVSTIGQ
jgi:hypothetical protein